MKISVLIVSKNRIGALQRCLGSICASSIFPDEVVIVDSSHRQNMIPVQTQFSLIYRHEKNINLPQARNLAVAMAKNETVIFVDDDCELFSDTLARAARALEKNSVSAVFGRARNGRQRNIATSVQQLFYDLWVEQITGDMNKSGILKEGFFPGLDIAAFRRGVLQKNKFCEDLPFGFDEDVVLGSRLSRSRKVMIYNPSIQVRHFGRNSLPSMCRRAYQTGYANEFIKQRIKIDTRIVSRTLSLIRSRKIYKENTRPLNVLAKAAFFFVVQIHRVAYLFGRMSADARLWLARNIYRDDRKTMFINKSL